MPTQERLRELFDYKDGSLHSKRTGRRIGFEKKSTGYRAVNIGYKHFFEHRLIWVWHNGPIPDGLQIDHIDRVRMNNRIENLRLATPKQNQKNRTVYPRIRIGIRGISWNRHGQSWRATIKVDYKSIYLGDFRDLEKAVAARRAAEDKYVLSRVVSLEAA